MSTQIEIYGTLLCLFPLSLVIGFVLYEMFSDMRVNRVERKVRLSKLNKILGEEEE